MAAAANLLEQEADEEEEDFDPFTSNSGGLKTPPVQHPPPQLMTENVKRKSSSDAEPVASTSSTSTAESDISTTKEQSINELFSLPSVVTREKLPTSKQPQSTQESSVFNVSTTSTKEEDASDQSQESPSSSLAFLMPQTPTHSSFNDQDIKQGENVLEKAQNALFAALGSEFKDDSQEDFAKPKTENQEPAKPSSTAEPLKVSSTAPVDSLQQGPTFPKFINPQIRIDRLSLVYSDR